MRGEGPGFQRERIRSRGDEPEVMEAEILHRPGDGTQVASNLGPDQHDATTLA